MAESGGFELAERRLLANQRLEFLLLENAFDRADAVRPLGVAGAVQVVERCGMGDEKCGHMQSGVRLPVT